MDIIQEVFVYVTLGFIIVGFAIGVVVDLNRKPKRNRLNK